MHYMMLHYVSIEVRDGFQIWHVFSSVHVSMSNFEAAGICKSIYLASQPMCSYIHLPD